MPSGGNTCSAVGQGSVAAPEYAYLRLGVSPVARYRNKAFEGVPGFL
jgi:hypothetical protein